MTTGHTYGDKDVKIISKESIYDGFLKFSKVKCCFKLFKGGWSSYVTRELIEKEEKEVISTLTATVGIGAALTLLGIPKI